MLDTQLTLRTTNMAERMMSQTVQDLMEEESLWPLFS